MRCMDNDKTTHLLGYTYIIWFHVFNLIYNTTNVDTQSPPHEKMPAKGRLTSARAIVYLKIDYHTVIPITSQHSHAKCKPWVPNVLALESIWPEKRVRSLMRGGSTQSTFTAPSYGRFRVLTFSRLFIGSCIPRSYEEKHHSLTLIN